MESAGKFRVDPQYKFEFAKKTVCHKFEDLKRQDRESPFCGFGPCENSKDA
jgi:hypothetical protein